MKGEALASGSEHADNIAPALFGGFTLVKSVNPLEILQIPSPDNLYVTIIHPQIEIKTAISRAMLPKNVALQDAITQWANVGSFIHSLHTNDYQLMKRSLHDCIVEPHRSKLIPYYNEVKQKTLDAGALGTNISGSGPSIYALSKGMKTAVEVGNAMKAQFEDLDIDNFGCHWTSDEFFCTKSIIAEPASIVITFDGVSSNTTNLQLQPSCKVAARGSVIV